MSICLSRVAEKGHDPPKAGLDKTIIFAYHEFMEGDKKGSGLSSVITEVAIAAVLVALILGTLNYFAILPLSNTFSFLSFLPQQSIGVKPQTRGNQGQQATTGQNQGRTSQVRQLIVPSDVKTFSNPTSEYKYNSIKDNGIKVTGPVRINVEMGVDLAPSAQKASDSSGLIFGNGLAKSKKDFRFLRIFYWPPSKNWSLQYQYGEKPEFFNLLSMPTGEIYARFSILISGNGRQVTVTLPTLEQKTFNLPDSLYTATNQMGSSIQVAPGQTVTVSSLNYQY